MEDWGWKFNQRTGTYECAIPHEIDLAVSTHPNYFWLTRISYPDVRDFNDKHMQQRITQEKKNL